MTKNRIDEKTKQNILNYADKIRHISVFSEGVRQNPGQYIGYIGNPGHINMIREDYQNRIDELQRKDSPCDYIRVEYYEATKTSIITDNGRGLPFEKMEELLTQERTSSNYDKEDGDFTAGMHGVGVKVTAALSSEFIAESYICSEVLGKAQGRRLRMEEGVPCESGIIEIPNDEDLQGTRIEFRPSKMIMGEITTTCEEVLHLVSYLIRLSKIGAVVDFYGVKTNGTVIQEHIVNEDGIVSFLICNTENPLIPPVIISKFSGKMKAEITFTYDSSEKEFEAEDILSFANTCPTVNERSTHVAGFLEALTNYFRIYMNKIYLSKSKLTVVNNDIKLGLKAVVSVSHIKPYFSGQAKEIFSNQDIVPFIKTMMSQYLDEWCKANPNDLQRLARHFKDAADLRTRADKEKVSMVKKYKTGLHDLPEKYEKPNPTCKEHWDHLELIIVEGDSAKSPCTNARCSKRQGILPIRGKITNAMTATVKKFFDNDDCAAIRDLMGSGYGKSFDLSKCPFEKVIILPDADLDGLHIRTLLLKQFLVYYAPLVEAGRLYCAVPPLYIAKVNKKFVYFKDKLEYIKYIQTGFHKDNKIYDANKNPISTSELNGILYRNSSYVDALEVIATTYAVDPFLLEYFIYIRKSPFAKFSKAIKKAFPFIDVKQQNGITILDGLGGNDKCQFVVLNEQFGDVCSKLFPYIDSDNSMYYINETPTSLYGLMNKFSLYKPAGFSGGDKGLGRAKGLGEMNPIQLRESTLHPDYNRNLIRYTVNDIKKEIQEIRDIDFNKALLLQDADIAGFEF